MTLLYNTVACDFRLRFVIVIRFIDHFGTRLVTTLNFNAIAKLHNIQITRTHKTNILCLLQSPIVVS
jgi:hypothetical protein